MEGRWKSGLLALVLGCLAFGTHGAAAQSPGKTPGPAKNTPPKVTFDVISVKPNRSGDAHARMNFDQDNFTCGNVNLHMLLSIAFHVQTSQLLNEPKWATTDRWDIAGKIAAEDIPSVRQLPFEQRLELFQEILRERFGLKAHHETRELPVYALVVANREPKIKPVKAPAGAETAMPGWPGMLTTHRGNVVAQGVLMEYLSEDLEDYVERPIVDRTGLKGRYDFTLNWNPDEEAGTGTASGTLPSLFTALQEQLGLKLESTKAKVDVVVIDHVEIPQQN